MLESSSSMRTGCHPSFDLRWHPVRTSKMSSVESGEISENPSESAQSKSEAEHSESENVPQQQVLKQGEGISDPETDTNPQPNIPIEATQKRASVEDTRGRPRIKQNRPGHSKKNRRPSNSSERSASPSPKRRRRVVKRKRKRLPSSSSSSTSSSDSSTSSSESEPSRRRQRRKKHRRRASRRSKKDEVRNGPTDNEPQSQQPADPNPPEPSLEPSQRTFFRTTSDEKKNEWQLKEELAKYVNGYINVHLPDKELECITIPNPIPTNLNIGRENDAYISARFHATTTENKGTLTHLKEKDKSLTAVQGRVGLIMGPLTKLYSLFDEAVVEQSHELDCQEVMEAIEKTVVMTSQALITLPIRGDLMLYQDTISRREQSTIFSGNMPRISSRKKNSSSGKSSRRT